MTLRQQVDAALESLGVGSSDRLGVACSGGGDSTALLHLLEPRRPVALHVDHGLRPDSGLDAEFVRELARGLSLPCRVLAADVERASRDGLQAAARRARYAALESAAADLDLRWIVTAHTLDDQAETVLLRAIRGGGVGGIAPVRAMFVRPLLGVDRESLRAWLQSRDLEWLEDASNDDLRFERNWLRAEVLPVLRRRRPGVALALARVADHARVDEEALDSAARRVLSRLRVDDTGVFVPGSDLESLPVAVQRRVVRGALRMCAGAREASFGEVEAVRQTAGHLEVAGLDVWRLAGGIAILRQPLPPPESLDLPPAGTLESEGWGIRLRVSEGGESPWRWRTALPDGAQASIRSRRPGDRVHLAAGSRKVQDVLVDAGIPRPLRGLVPVVATAAGPLAVVGVAAADGPSKRVIDVEPVPGSWSREALWASR